MISETIKILQATRRDKFEEFIPSFFEGLRTGTQHEGVFPPDQIEAQIGDLESHVWREFKTDPKGFGFNSLVRDLALRVEEDIEKVGFSVDQDVLTSLLSGN